MNKILLLSALVTFFLYSCDTDIYNKPDDLIPSDKIVLIIEEIHICDAVLSEMRSGGKDFKVTSKYYYNSIYKKYNITRKQFDESLKYYTSKPGEIEEIYESVAARLSKREKEIMQQERKNTKQ